MRFRLLHLLIASAAAIAAEANDFKLTDGRGDVPLAGLTIRVDRCDYPVVAEAARMLADDLEAVTGKPSRVSDRAGGIIAGTSGHSQAIDSLIEAGVIDAVEGRERFVIKAMPGMLVIAGSDRRGTAYGMMTLSRMMGVSPWIWWADVPAPSRPDVSASGVMTSSEPAVRYRGIFINDEDWGLLPWAATNYEKELGDIGPRTYERVCQLLLRLKLNMLAPAMHSVTGAFYSHPESKEVLDRYGIIVTTSHCEPMLLNNAAPSEWSRERDGEWDYRTNRDVIRGKFDSRVAEAAPYENIYTVAMRGVHDEGMRGAMSTDERVQLLQQVIADQREILHDRLGCDAAEVPQIFVPYKETLDLYRAGLQLPDDVTIVWPDDNYGYIKQLPDSTERRRSGGHGVYYHTSYLGTPHDYLWLCTTPPALMYEELKKAWDTGADRYWLLNVGDIKPAEMATEMFADMAWDMEAFDYENANRYQAAMLGRLFGHENESKFAELLDDYYRLAWIRKPEYMGWEYEWDAPELTRLRPSTFSITRNNEMQRRLAEYNRLSDLADSLMEQLPEQLRPAFYEMVAYPAMASREVNRKFLMYAVNDKYSREGRHDIANYAARQCREAHDSIAALTLRYNTMLGGKWRGMMDVPPGFCALYHLMPELHDFPGAGESAEMTTVDPAHDDIKEYERLNMRNAACTPGCRVIEGLGYDGCVLQMGEAAARYDSVPTATWSLPAIDADRITVQIYHLPVWPLNAEAGTTLAVTMDDGETQYGEYVPVEWSAPWKENVLRNSAVTTLTFDIDRNAPTHTLVIKSPYPGNMVQKVVII